MIEKMKEEVYIPTAEKWGELYGKWNKRLVRSLSSMGNLDECEEAVSEAFYKVMGYSENLHLEKPLVAKSDTEWFGFLKYQAMGRLSCYHQRQKRFVELRDWSVKEETIEDDSWGEVSEDPAYAVRYSVEDGDDKWVRDEFRKTLSDVCRESGVKDVNREAYVLFALEGKSGEQVEHEVDGIKANNVYQIRSRVERLMGNKRDRFEYIYRELKAA